MDEKNSNLTDPADLAVGKTIYTTNCAACHRDGGGQIGPNLTDVLDFRWRNKNIFPFNGGRDGKE
jgi:cytochrome c oxidase cbb3-type subunit 3